MMTRDEFNRSLETSAVSFVFVKMKDGQERKMTATKSPALIPADKLAIGESRSRQTNDLCVVWDLDISEWRSFRYDTIRSIEGEAYPQGI